MPYKDLKEVPENIAKHKGAELTLDQANKWAQIFDALKSQSSVQNPAAAAWSTFEEVFEVQDGKWTRRKREQAESMEYAETVGYVQNIEERGTDGLPSKARVVIIQAGPTKTKRRDYPKAALQALVESKMLDGLKQYDSHPPGSEVIPGATQSPRTIKEYLSYIIPGTVQWSENIRLASGELVQGVTALAKIVDKGFKEKLAEAAETIGVSLNCLWDAYMVGDVQTARRPRKAISADWVTDPNAGGLVLELVEAMSPDSIPEGKEVPLKMPVLENWSDLTPEMLRANCPHVVQSIKDENAQAEAAAKAIVEQAKCDAETRANTAQAEAETAQAEAKAATEKLTATEKEFAEFKTATTASTLKLKAIEMVEAHASNLNALGKAEVMKNILAKQFTTETEMAEAVTSEIAKVPSVNKQTSTQPAAKAGEEKPHLTGRVAEMAESMGYSEEEKARLAKVR
jgi:hypothetical protein